MEQFNSKKDIGSSRIRAHWLYQIWDKVGDEIGTAEEFKIGGRYDAIIFQKVYWTEFAEKYEGIKILDICDADWLEWGHRVIQMINACDAITCSTEAISEHIQRLTDKPVFVIPDRIRLDLLGDKRKEHKGEAKTVAWYGYNHNFDALDAAFPIINGLGLDLIVISNKSYIPPANRKIEVKNYPWSMATVDDDLLRADIVINPKLGFGNWKYKSNNKTIHAWALGLPVAHNDVELKALFSEEARKEEANRRRLEVEEKYNAEQSVRELKDILQLLYAAKSSGQAIVSK